MVILVAVLAVVFVVVIPGLMFMLALCRAADVRALSPDEHAPVSRPVPVSDRQIAGQMRLFHMQEATKPWALGRTTSDS